MSILARAVAKYDAVERLSLDRIPVCDLQADRAWTAATTLVRLIDGRERPSVWAVARNAAVAFRWLLLTRPLRALDGQPNVDIAVAVAELATEERRLAGRVDTVVLEALHQLVSAGQDLDCEADELAEQIVTSASEGAAKKTCVVLVGTASRQATEVALAARLPGVRFLSPRQFLGGDLWDRAVVVGISAWYPDELFTAPRCRDLTLVHHQWLRDRKQVEGVFTGIGAEGLQVTMPPQNETRVRLEEIQSPVESVDWSVIEPVGGKPHDSDPSDDVPAHLVLLAGGYGFYLGHDADSIRGLDPACTDNQWIRQMPATELGPDSVVILREGVSERETLRPRISVILGEGEAVVRNHQAEWKEILAARLEIDGIEILRRALRRPGLTWQYARHWAGSTSISPRQPTFTRLLEYLDVPDVAGCLDSAKRLYSAHHMAGKQLARELEKLVDAGVVKRLNTEHSVTLAAEKGIGSVRATLFKVVAVSPEFTIVPAAALRTAMKMKGTAWLG